MAVAVDNEIKFNDCKSLIQNIVYNNICSRAANLSGSASGGWSVEVDAMFRPGGYRSVNVTDGRHYKGWVQQYRNFSVASPLIQPVSGTIISTQYSDYITQCLNTYPIVVNSVDALFKSILWLLNCSYVFMSTKLIGLTSSLVPGQTVIVYDTSAQVPVLPIQNDTQISNPYYEASSEDPLINCFNLNTLSKLKDQVVRNYSSKDNITSLLNSFASNLQSVVHTTAMSYSIAFQSCSCCSSSCCSSSSWFLAYTSL